MHIRHVATSQNGILQDLNLLSYIIYCVCIYIYTYMCVCVGLSEIVYSQTTWFFMITCPIEMTIWIHLGADTIFRCTQKTMPWPWLYILHDHKYIYIYYIYSCVQYPHYIPGTQQFPKAFPNWSQAFRLPRCCRPNPSRGAHHRKLKKELRSNQMDMVKFWLNMLCIYIYIWVNYNDLTGNDG